MDLRRLVTFGWYAGDAIAIAACGVAVIAVGGWLLSRIARKYGVDPHAQAGRTIQTFGKLPAKEYDAVRAEAVRRQAAASYRQKQSAQIASGEDSEPQIRIVGERGHR